MGYRDEEHLLPKSRDSTEQHDGDNNNDNNNNSSGYDSIRDQTSATVTTKESVEATENSFRSNLVIVIRTLPAVLVIAAWNIMLSVPFGSMFFSDEVPLATHTKEMLGMRMSMMALGVGESVMGGWLTDFEALTVWALAEVAPFYKIFAQLAVGSCGDDPSKIYPTTVYLISLSTIAVGIAFFVCGFFKIGKFLSFFPSYVTLGVVAGIGVWAMTMAVTISASSHIFEGGIEESDETPGWWNHAATPQFALSLFLGLAIRPIRKVFPDFLLLDPVYFLSIPIVFHCVIALLGINFDEAVDAGYMFQAPSIETVDLLADDQHTPSIWQEARELWTLFDFSKVQWGVAFQAAPQIFAGAILAVMITAPFIPPIATLGKMEKEFSADNEFMAHGIANIVSGLVVPGGVPLCACYSSTVLYRNSGGGGRCANFLLSVSSFLSFVYGPMVAGYLPRCMASAILIDMGIALLLEGVGNDEHKCDPVEYLSIWVILSIMTIFDMTSGLIAGLFMALFTSTYASSGDDPVRRVCDAQTFPSSRRRKDSEKAFLDDPLTGRGKIAIFQLQGSLFFGNVSKIQDRLFGFLENSENNIKDSIVILDCTLVSSLDSSACLFFDKINSTLRKDYGVVATVFVASPSKLELEKAASKRASLLTRAGRYMGKVNYNYNYKSALYHNRNSSLANEVNPSLAFSQRPLSQRPGGENQRPKQIKRRSSMMTTRGSYGWTLQKDIQIHGTCFEFLDQALESCEDKLLSLARIPIPLNMETNLLGIGHNNDDSELNSDRTRAMALRMLKTYCDIEDQAVLKSVVDAMKREVLPKGTVLWNLGDSGLSAKLFLKGSVFAFVLDDGDDNRFRASMAPGSFLGLRSLVLDERHMANARCEEESVFYSLEKEAYDKLVKDSPEASRALELSMARYLSHRLRHVSNRIYQAHSVPV